MIDPNEALKEAKKLIKNCTFLSFYKKGGTILVKCVVLRDKVKVTTMYSIGYSLDTLTKADFARLVEIANEDVSKTK